MIRALIFDFDGLMLDTEGPDYRAWQEVFAQHGHELPLAVWSECIGRAADWFDPLARLESLVGTPIDRDAGHAWQRERHRELIEAEPLLPGVSEYLMAARRLGLRLAIASSSSPGWVGGHLERLKLSAYFECVRCWGDVERAKPAPNLYLAALASLGVTASEAIAFEDSFNGVRAAKEAGLFCVAVPNALTAHLDLGQADLLLRSFADLPLPALLARVSHHA